MQSTQKYHPHDIVTVPLPPPSTEHAKALEIPSAKTSMDSGLPDSNSAEVEKLDSSPFGNKLNWAVKEDWTSHVMNLND